MIRTPARPSSPRRLPGSRPLARLPTTPRWPPLLIGCLVALLAHVLALAGLHWTWGRQAVAPGPTKPFIVRTLSLLPQVPAVFAATPVAGSVVSALRPMPPPVSTRPWSVARPAPPASVRPAAPAPAPIEPVSAGPAAVDPTAVAEASGEVQLRPEPAVPEADKAETEAVPSYRTVLPPAASLGYQVRRGPASGRGDLRWRLTADGYELDLTIEAGERVLLAQTSRGGFDAAGLAPLRFTDKRLRRPVSAANFQRDVGWITFSGPATSYPIRPGTQDRLSWLLQIASIVAAEPSLRVGGARLLMNVVGAHGDAAVWVFVCQAPESDSPAGQLAYRREPHGPYETAAEVWLDPKNGYLPSRAAWKSGASDDGFELRLPETAPPP